MNKEKTFMDIKLFVTKWYDRNLTYLKNNSVDTNILRNDQDGFVVSFDTDIAMAELVVEKAGYAPYRYVSFEIATVESGQAKISYSWYDNASTSKNEINNQLTDGINYLINL